MADTNITTTTWRSKTVTCPSCSCAIPYFDLSKSIVFACPQCATLFEHKDDGSNYIITVFDKEKHYPFALSIGTTAVYEDVEYLLVGAMSKKQTNQEVYWDEYVFYSAGDKNYLIFSEYDGHWLLIRPAALQTMFPDLEDKIHYSHREYTLDLQYHFRITFAEGEFDWNILDDESLEAFEYISQPYVLINEKNDKVWNWYEAVYVAAVDLLKIINIPPEKLAIRRSTIEFNPETFYPRYRAMMRFTGLALGIFLLFHLFLGFTHEHKTVYKGMYECQADTGSWAGCKPVITPQFTINGTGPVGINMRADQIDNDWLELQVVMINDDNGKLYETDKTIEFYHGVDGGESWSEGDRSVEAIISGVPSGNYHLNIYPFNNKTKDSVATGSVSTFNIAVEQNVFLSSNFWPMLLLLLFYPTIQIIRKYKFENTLWFETGYTTLKDKEE